jgi:hypothetical protein
VNSFFAALGSQHPQMTCSALSYLNFFVKTPVWSSATNLPVSEFILERLLRRVPTLAAQLADPECYPLAIELLTAVASTSATRAGVVLAVITANPIASLAMSDALLRFDAFVSPNSSGAAAIKLLTTIAKLNSFGQVIHSISNSKEKIVFAREFSCSKSGYLRPTTQLIAQILEAIKPITKTDLPLAIALLTAVVGSNSSTQALDYLNASKAKKSTDELDKYFEDLLSAAISLSSSSSASMLASSVLTPAVKHLYLANLYQRPDLLLMDTEDKQYRDVHASNMQEAFKDEARQMILRASPDAPDIELQRLTELLGIGRSTTPLFVAARGFLENKINALIPNFFLLQITDETDKAGVMAYIGLRQEYFVLYDTFLSNPEAEISPEFIAAEYLRMATFPADMKAVLQSLFSRYTRQTSIKTVSNIASVMDSKAG